MTMSDSVGEFSPRGRGYVIDYRGVRPGCEGRGSWVQERSRALSIHPWTGVGCTPLPHRVHIAVRCVAVFGVAAQSTLREGGVRRTICGSSHTCFLLGNGTSALSGIAWYSSLLLKFVPGKPRRPQTDTRSWMVIVNLSRDLLPSAAIPFRDS